MRYLLTALGRSRVGAQRGLGYLMLLASGQAKIYLMFAALVVLAAPTLFLHPAGNFAPPPYAGRMNMRSASPI